MISPARGVGGAFVALALAGVLIGVWPVYAQHLLVTGGIADGAGLDIGFTVLVFGALLAAGLLGGLATGVRAAAIGPQPGAAAGRGALVGLVGIAISLGLTGVAGTLRLSGTGSASALLLAGLATVAFQVTAEEVYFRGWLQPMLATAIGLPAAAAVTGVAFGLLHGFVAGADPIGLINMCLGGVLFGLLAARGGGIAAALGAHGAWNLVEELGIGLDPNPGQGSFGTLLDWTLVGSGRWGGSENGLNASWAMTAGLLAVLVPLILLTRPSSPAAGRSDPARA